MSLGRITTLGKMSEMQCFPSTILVRILGKVVRILISDESFDVTASRGGIAASKLLALQNQYFAGIPWDTFVQKQALRY